MASEPEVYKAEMASLVHKNGKPLYASQSLSDEVSSHALFVCSITPASRILPGIQCILCTITHLISKGSPDSRGEGVSLPCNFL